MKQEDLGYSDSYVQNFHRKHFDEFLIRIFESTGHHLVSVL